MSSNNEKEPAVLSDVQVAIDEELAEPEDRTDARSTKSHRSLAANFIVSAGLTSAEADELIKEWGKNELVEKTVPKWIVFGKILIQPMPIMIWVAAIVEGAIENWPDMGILLGIQFLNASLSFYETTKAGDAVAALKASLKPSATVKRDGKWVPNFDASLLVPGDLVLLGSGSAVPADCFVNHGTIDVDQAALTGESLPVTMYKGDSVKMGSTVVRGEVEATVECTGKNTFFGKTASMLQETDELGNLQKILMRIMMILVAISALLCIITLIYLLVKGEAFRDAISFTVVLLVASIPIAIEIVVTTTLALGSRQLSKDGAIVSRLNAIEDLAGMNMLCSDKTGTLTLNKMVIQDETPIFSPGETQYSILRYAAMAARWKEPPRDALDTLVLNAVDIPSLEGVKQVDYMPFDPTIKRTEGTIENDDKSTFKITKGAPHIIMKLLKDPVVEKELEHKVHELGLRGIRSLAVAKSEAEGVWKLLGLLTFLDPPRPDTKDTIMTAMKFGVDVKMITGDHLLIAKETARVLGMGSKFADATQLPSLEADGKLPSDLGQKYGNLILAQNGFAQVYPEHKYLIVEALRQIGYKVGMTGDGVNDAPALKRADVGLAVQGATDAARAAADIVLTRPGLSTIIKGIVVSRTIFARMQNFITYRIAATLQLLVFFFIAVLSLHPRDYQPDDENYPVFFHMPVLMLMLITLLNDGTLISIGYDIVKPSAVPEKWNLPLLFTIASVLGGVACLSSLLMLWVALDSHTPGNLLYNMGIGNLSYAQITTMVYLKVSISDFLTLFSARTRDNFFWTVRPSPILLVAAGIALCVSTALATAWADTKVDNIATIGLGRTDPKLLSLWVWIYCIICWFIQDTAKVVVFFLLKRFHILMHDEAPQIDIVEMQDIKTASSAAPDDHKPAGSSSAAPAGHH